MKSYWKMIVWCLVGIIVFLVIIPLIVAALTTIHWIDVETSNDWIGFCADYLGSLIGGVASFVGIFITIHYTKEENRKERELMYLPYIRVEQCKPDESFSWICIATDGNYVEDGKNCIVSIRIKNVGIGPLLNFGIKEFEYTSGNKKKIVISQSVYDEMLEKDRVINITFEFNLNIHDCELEGILPEENMKIYDFLGYGGELTFKITGNDLCDNPYEKIVNIRVQGQICEEEGRLVYKPQAYLR